ncbi:NIL domain-containing protein [Breznakiella homolactica]|uniref:4Fe-4S binding protein n=1 Tax=Breznakiella homolactica TaxID=2798577 RepID=A0A7T8B919_9SPIR|nr:NIL domain-containing protein [Breznakiella homolactica]QQO07490.1 4Fe-4S binding protein [Breznakiella homolactica]
MSEKFVLGYASDTVSEPILWKLVKDFNIKVNILKASISPGMEGNLLVEFDAENPHDLARALKWLKSLGVSCVNAAKRLTWAEELCVDCGACSGVCFSDAITMDRGDWKIMVDRDKCVACGNCVKACPFGCYCLDFGE